MYSIQSLLSGGNHRSDAPNGIRDFATAEVCCIVFCWFNVATESFKHLLEEAI